MEFHVLGPLAVQRGGDAVDLGPRMQRALLAVLLIHANQLLPVERILDALWGEDATGKEKALRVHVSRLRKALEPERVRGDSSVLETVGAAYRLNVDVDQLDLTRFEALAAQGRRLVADDPAAASELLASALSLWSGSAYEDFSYEDFAQLEITRLADLRVDVIEERIEADLARGLAGQLVSELEVLRDQHPLRERLVRQHALALYRSGRPAEALRAIDRFRRHVGDELGIEPSPMLLRLEEQVLLHDQSIQARQSSVDDLAVTKLPTANPFKGLRAFGADDANLFFGRDALVAELLRNIGGGQHLISLVGASGSGKSSVVRAGLIPALAKGAIEGSDRWLVATMLPGAHPFAELEAALLRSILDAPDSLRDQLQGDDAGFLRAALRILPDDESHLVLFIDQFEELFALGASDEVRARFLSNLVTAVDDPHGRVTVVITLRADFYAQPLTHPEFGARLGSAVVNVTPLSAEELEAAARRPAAEVGVSFEPALLGQLIADVGSQPGALPLFQYSLTELFDRRAGDTLAASAYRSMGGIVGAIQRRASDLFDRLDDQQQDAARQLFLRLVAVSPDGQRSRRRVPAREIASLAADTVTMQHVIGQFGDHRLLSFDSDRLTGAPTVEVAHEALLTAWPTLEQWVEEGRDDLRQHRSLTTALLEWQLTDRDPDYLLSESRLGAFDDWVQSSQMQLNDEERSFLSESRAQVVERRAAESQRHENEARARRRLWVTIAALAASLGVVAMFLFGPLAPDEEPVVTFLADRNVPGLPALIGSGLDRAGRELGVNVVDVPRAGDPVEAMRQLAATGPEIIISDALGLGDGSVLLAYPDVNFGFVDQVATGPNVTTARFANHEGAFLAGAAAALRTETGVVGFIGASHFQLIEEFQAGFEAGARAVDPDITILVAYIRQFSEIEVGESFGRPDLGQARAEALYQRDADVIFTAAGHSGMGMFEAAAAQSEVMGRHLWAIGVDTDQWFDVRDELRPHVLTSVIKRIDVAAYELARHMTSDDSAGLVVDLDLANGGFTYATSGDNLEPEIVAALDDYVEAISEQRIEVPVRSAVEPLRLGLDGNEIDGPEPATHPADRQVDGLEPGALLEPDTYDLEAMGTPLAITVDDTLITVNNMHGYTAFGQPGWSQPGDRDVTFIRPQVLADPTQPQASFEAQICCPPLDDIEGWIDQLVDGIVTHRPEATEIGGAPAIYFEVEITDQETCGRFGYCAGFVVNRLFDDGGISGWSFELGFHYRIWWVDQGDQPPIAIIAGTPSGDRSSQAIADDLLATLVIGDPQPHPIGDLLS